MTDPDDFAARLAALLSAEMTASRNDPDRMAAMLERVAAGLGFTIALMARGDAGVIGELMAGAEGYAMEEATRMAPVARRMGMTIGER